MINIPPINDDLNGNYGKFHRNEHVDDDHGHDDDDDDDDDDGYYY